MIGTRLGPYEITAKLGEGGMGEVYRAKDTRLVRSGWHTCARLTVSAMETEDHRFLAGATDAGEALDEAQCRRLFDLPAPVGSACSVPEPIAARHAVATPGTSEQPKV